MKVESLVKKLEALQDTYPYGSRESNALQHAIIAARKHNASEVAAITQPVIHEKAYHQKLICPAYHSITLGPDNSLTVNCPFMPKASS